MGRYYGTSDDFDEAREGYLPGFYVSKLLDLRFEDNKVTFMIDPDTKDMFTEKIALDIMDSEQALDEGYVNWQSGIPIGDIQFEGTIGDDTITIKGPYDMREFKKKIL